MRDQSQGTYGLAFLVIVGTFTIIIIDQIRGVTISADVMTLVGTTIGTVIGHFFGARGVATGSANANEILTTTLTSGQGPTPQAPPGPPVPGMPVPPAPGA